MSEANPLKTSIIEQAHQEGQLKLEAAKKQIQNDFEDRKAQLQTEKANERQSQLKEVNQSFQIEAQQIKNQERQSTLVSKQKVLKELFASALEQMENWRQEEELSFVKKVLSKYGQRAVTVQFGQLTADKLDSGVLQQLQADFPHVTFDDHPIADEAGLVISLGKIDDNYLYANLIDSIYKEESSRIAADIFKED
ncbi:ATP synthase subunit E [Streptococcus devriesei]|uniref:ATP synthase subunit E n=1 Tax=Streptococcus devriesei TaxID=231233 RepID=UPI0004091269|nr:ATP synthase subunit E [Streptococcus devriesei]